MKYILATTDKKSGKRKVVKRSVDYFWLKATARHTDHNGCKVEIYTGNWTLVEEV